MTFLRPLLAAALLLGLAACDSKPKTAEPPAPRVEAAIGVNAEVENDVRLRSVQDQAWRPAALQGEVRYADDIATAADSRLVVALQDQSSLTVGPNARLTIDRFVIDTTTGAPGAAVSMTRGAFRFASRSRGKEAVSFRTPVATIGVRGTVLLGVVGPDALTILPSGPAMLVLSSDPNQATLIVLREGIIDIKVGDKVFVLDRPGLALAVGEGGRTYGPFLMPTAADARLDALLAPRARRSDGGPAIDPPAPPPPRITPPKDPPRQPPRGPRAPVPLDPLPEPKAEPPPRTPPPGRPTLSKPQVNRPQLSSPGGPRAEPPPATRGPTLAPPPRGPTYTPPRGTGGERGPAGPSVRVPVPGGDVKPPNQPQTQPQTQPKPKTQRDRPTVQKPSTPTADPKDPRSPRQPAQPPTEKPPTNTPPADQKDPARPSTTR